MRTLENNDFMILNNIIYKIHTKVDFLNMRKEFLEQIKMILDFDSADFYLSEGDGKVTLIDQVTYNCPLNIAKDFETQDYSQGILSSGKCMIYKESDILQEDKRVKTQYYKNVYKVNHWHHALQCVLAYDQEFLGVITFYRTLGKSDYEYSDIFLLDMIKDHLAYRIYKERQNTTDKRSLANAIELYALTKKEQVVLEMMMQGLSNDEICEKNVITYNTLKKHVYNLYRKIGVRNRIELFKLIGK
ncbi:MAG: helix-turn-helix transcriptional regulator [Lachnospiraceae bacterium]